MSARHETCAGSASVRILGIAATPLVMGDEALQALTRHEIGPLAVVCMSGRLVREARVYSGWLLKDVLGYSGLASIALPRLKQSLILCYAADGYRAIFSWNELFNTQVGDGVLLVPEADGSITLVSAADLRGGARNLRGLKQIGRREMPL